MTTLKTGDKAPQFSGLDQNGTTHLPQKNTQQKQHHKKLP